MSVEMGAFGADVSSPFVPVGVTPRYPPPRADGDVAAAGAGAARDAPRLRPERPKMASQPKAASQTACASRRSPRAISTASGSGRLGALPEMVRDEREGYLTSNRRTRWAEGAEVRDQRSEDRKEVNSEK